MNRFSTILLDTNIWLDAYLEHREGHKSAVDLIAFCESHEDQLVYSSTSIKDAYYIINQELKHILRSKQGCLTEQAAVICQKMAWGCIRNMAEVALALPVGEPQIWLASHFESLHRDFEDDLILAVIEISNIDYFVTGDKRLQDKVSTPSFNATDMLALFHMRESAGYAD